MVRDFILVKTNLEFSFFLTQKWTKFWMRPLSIKQLNNGKNTLVSLNK